VLFWDHIFRPNFPKYRKFDLTLTLKKVFKSYKIIETQE
jgi:hypothetical protein